MPTLRERKALRREHILKILGKYRLCTLKVIIADLLVLHLQGVDLDLSGDKVRQELRQLVDAGLARTFTIHDYREVFQGKSKRLKVSVFGLKKAAQK